jgi:hypothetical protein
MSNGLNGPEWIPLVEQVGDRFNLSKPLLELVGPSGWGGNLWQVKAFVAHMITYFEDGFEHFLDNEDDDGIEGFHVSPAFCEHLAKKFESEFLPVSPDWYHELARAKLLTLRVPRRLVTEAKLGWFMKHHDPKLLAHIMIDLPKLKGTPVPEEVSQRILDAVGADNLALTWATLEEAAKWLLSSKTLNEDELSTLLEHDSLAEYHDFIARYTDYLRKDHRG